MAQLHIQSLKTIFKALHEHEVDYVLVGGIAVILHGVPRVTEDIDLFVRRDPANIEKLKTALRSVFNDESVEEITFDDLQEYSVIRYGTPENYYIDIVDRIGEMFNYDDLKHEIVQSQGISVRVATVETLIKLKEGTLREIDKADVIMLKDKYKDK